MIRRGIRQLLALLFLCACVAGCGGGGDPAAPPDDPGPSSTVPCPHPDERCREGVSVGNGFVLPVYRTHPIRVRDTTVVRAVIVIHGAGGNGAYAFETMIDAATWAHRWPGTLIIAPHFQTPTDNHGPNDATWTSNGWKRGDESYPRPGTPATVSSYEAVDVILRILGDTLRFPRLEKVVVAGHSAGGQYSHRYAATSPVEDELAHLSFRYVVANPSTYLYLGPERALEGGGWGLPNLSACPSYDDWHYGFAQRNPYAQRLTPGGIRTRLLGRDVIYMVGTEDLGTDALDMSCGAMLQGSRRYYRGLTLFAFLNHFYPQHAHRLFEIQGVAHSSRGVYLSEAGLQMIFDWGVG